MAFVSKAVTCELASESTVAFLTVFLAAFSTVFSAAMAQRGGKGGCGGVVGVVVSKDDGQGCRCDHRSLYPLVNRHARGGNSRGTEPTRAMFKAGAA